MTYQALEIHPGYFKIVWSDGTRLIIGGLDANRIRKEYPGLPVIDKR